LSWGVAVVFWGGALKFKGDISALFTIGGNGFDWIELLAITEGDLNPKCAIR
jgi:hypothetical protein